MTCGAVLGDVISPVDWAPVPLFGLIILGAIAFLAVSRGPERAQHRRVAWVTALVSSVLLVLALLAGAWSREQRKQRQFDWRIQQALPSAQPPITVKPCDCPPSAPSCSCL